MVQVLLSKEMVKVQIDDVFKRLNSDDLSHEMKQDEAGLIWFELFGMQRIIRTFEWQVPRLGLPGADRLQEFFEVRELMKQALKRAEKAFESAGPR